MVRKKDLSKAYRKNEKHIKKAVLILSTAVFYENVIILHTEQKEIRTSSFLILRKVPQLKKQEPLPQE